MKALKTSGRARNVGRVCPARTNGGYGLFTSEPIQAGELLFQIKGELTSRPSRYSFQVDQNLHIDVHPGCTLEEMINHCFWWFMNHHCEPNAMVRGQEVLAVRAIPSLEEVTFNYNTTEYELVEPFACHCSSNWCLGHIRGFKHLSLSERERLRPWLAPHLVRLWETELARPATLGTPHNRVAQ